jgi:hypothetical protein
MRAAIAAARRRGRMGALGISGRKIPNNLDADVEVTYAVTFDASDRDTNRRYDEVVELVGVDDGPPGPRRDPRPRHPHERRGQVSRESNLVIDDFNPAHA